MDELHLRIASETVVHPCHSLTHTDHLMVEMIRDQINATHRTFYMTVCVNISVSDWEVLFM